MVFAFCLELEEVEEGVVTSNRHFLLIMVNNMSPFILVLFPSQLCMYVANNFNNFCSHGFL